MFDTVSAVTSDLAVMIGSPAGLLRSVRSWLRLAGSSTIAQDVAVVGIRVNLGTFALSLGE